MSDKDLEGRLLLAAEDVRDERRSGMTTTGMLSRPGLAEVEAALADVSEAKLFLLPRSGIFTFRCTSRCDCSFETMELRFDR